MYILNLPISKDLNLRRNTLAEPYCKRIQNSLVLCEFIRRLRSLYADDFFGYNFDRYLHVYNTKSQMKARKCLNLVIM